MSAPSSITNASNIQTIPVHTEKYAISKSIITRDFTIEKRMVEGIATIKVPVKYEEIYVNGKRFGSGTNSLDTLLSSLKGITSRDNNSDQKYDSEKDERISKKKAALQGELAPLSDGMTEQVLPLFGEEIIIKRRMKQVGEAVITKRRVTENKKISLDVKGEKIMIRYPDGTERTLESTAPSPSLTTEK
jgi:stress response protein YsnF